MSVLKTIGIQHLNGSSQAVTLQPNNNVTFANNVYIRGQTGQVTNPLQIKFSNDYPGAGGASSNTADKMKLVFYDNSPIDIYSIGVGPSADMQYHAYQGSFGQGSHNFYTENLLRMKIDGSGRITKPYQPMCWATHNSEVAYTSGQLVRWTASYDPLSMFSGASNYRVTVPVAGRYLVSVDLLLNTGSSGPLAAVLRKNGSAVRRFYTANGYSYSQSGMTLIVNCAANDYLDVIANETANYWGGDIGNFTVCLIG